MKKKKGVKIISRGMNNTSAKEARELQDYYDDLFRQYRQTGNVSQETLDAVGRTGFEDDDSDDDDHSYDDSFMAGINEMLGRDDSVEIRRRDEDDKIEMVQSTEFFDETVGTDVTGDDDSKPITSAVTKVWVKKHMVRPISIEYNWISKECNIINIQSMQKHGRTIDIDVVRHECYGVFEEDAIADAVKNFKESLDTLFPAILTYASSIVNPVVVISAQDFVRFIKDVNMSYLTNMRFKMLAPGKCAIYLIDFDGFKSDLDRIHLNLLKETVTVATDVICQIITELTKLKTCCAADLALYDITKNINDYTFLCKFINTSTDAMKVRCDSDDVSETLPAYLDSMNENGQMLTTESVDAARDIIINWVSEYAPDDDDTDEDCDEDKDVDSSDADTDQDIEDAGDDDNEEAVDNKPYIPLVFEEASDTDDDKEENESGFGTPLIDKLKGLNFAASKEAAAEISDVDDIDLTSVAVHTKG